MDEVFRQLFADAVLKLRPEFAARLEIRADLHKNDHYDYFGTIPRDIIGVICEYLPDLRAKYDPTHIAKCEEQTKQFIDKYATGYRNGYMPVYVDHDKIIKDYPHVKFREDGMLYVKMLDRNFVPCHKSEYTYIGTNKQGQHQCLDSITMTIVTLNGLCCNEPSIHQIAPSKINIALDDMIFINLLPCGLLMVTSRDRYAYLYDITTGEFVAMFHKYEDVLKYLHGPFIREGHVVIDDFGNTCEISSLAMQFSNLDPWFLVLH